MDFVGWLNLELQRRGWSRGELAKRGHISASMVYKVLNHDTPPGRRFAEGVAVALGISPEQVFREAGILPSRPSADAVIDELIGIAEKLPPNDQQELIDLARVKLERRERAAQLPIKP